MKSKTFIIFDELFNNELVFSTASDDDLYLWFKKNKNFIFSDEEKEKIKVEGNGKTIRTQGGGIIVRVKSKKKIDEAIIVHELFHAVFFILERKGVPLNYENDEIFAYYQEFLFRKIIDKIKNS